MPDASKWAPTRLTGTSAAPPEVVYDVLADLRTHSGWSASNNAKAHLTTLEAPEGPAVTGTEFRSNGLDLMGNTFNDSSIVTEASRPSVFAFRTKAHMDYKKAGKRPWELVVEHRYEIAPEGSGSRVTYVSTPVEANYLPWYLTAPVAKSMTGMMIRSALGKGFNGMLRLSDERSRQT